MSEPRFTRKMLRGMGEGARLEFDDRFALRCPKCFAYGAEMTTPPRSVQVAGHGHRRPSWAPQYPEPTYIKDDCDVCHGAGKLWCGLTLRVVGAEERAQAVRLARIAEIKAELLQLDIEVFLSEPVPTPEVQYAQ